MLRPLGQIALVVLAVALAPGSALSDPVTLKFAYISSDRTSIYRDAIAPFVEAVNAEAGDHVRIEVAFSGALGRNPLDQVQLVLDGTADIAFVVQGSRPDLFPDDGVIQLPGLYNNLADATRVYLKLVKDNALRGYDQFFVIGVFAGEPETIHTRAPVATLDDLAGKRLRVTNLMESAAIEKLGATSTKMPINQIAIAMGNGEIDGALVPAGEPLIEFGVARIAAHHYLLGVSTIPLAIVMNRAAFDALPEPARAIIVKYSGDWIAESFVVHTEASTARVLADLKADPQRKVVEPSAADLERAAAAFQAVTDDWLAADPANAALLAKAEAELAKAQ